jgi:hypothetical protein
VDADHCFDLARTLRVVGTWNLKREEPEQAVILAYHPERVYALEDFAAWKGSEPRKVKNRPAPTWDPLTLPSNFEAQLSDKRNKTKKELWQRITAPSQLPGVARHPDGRIDRHKNQWAVSKLMLKEGYTVGHVISVLIHPEWEVGEKYREEGSYVQVTSTANNANDEILEETELNRYFSRETFLPPVLGQELLDREHIITVDEQLYLYRDGVYTRSQAERFIREAVKDVLGTQWRAEHENQVITWLTGRTQKKPEELGSCWLNGEAATWPASCCHRF